MSETSCLNPQTGTQIGRYELGCLSDIEQEVFEQHLLECDFCRHELEHMLPVSAVLRANKQLLIAELAEHGLSFEEQRARMLREARERRRLADLPLRSRQWVISLVNAWRRPYVLAPALAVIAVSVLLVVRWSWQPQSPFVALLDYAPLAAADVQLRGVQSSAARLYAEGMYAYHQGDFNKAAAKFSQSVEADPSQGTVWLYLGIAYFELKEPDRAISALRQAAGRTEYAAHDYARYYLAQAYLLANRPIEAGRFLGELASQGGPLAAKADSLGVKVQQVESKQLSR